MKPLFIAAVGAAVALALAVVPLAPQDSPVQAETTLMFNVDVPVGSGALDVYSTGGLSALDYGYGINYTSNPDYVGPAATGTSPADNPGLFAGDPPYTYGGYAPGSTDVLEALAESEGNSHGLASQVGVDFGSWGFQNIESYANQITVGGQTLDCLICDQFDLYGQDWGGPQAIPLYEAKVALFTNALPTFESNIPMLNLQFGSDLPELDFPLDSGSAYGGAAADAATAATAAADPNLFTSLLDLPGI